MSHVFFTRDIYRFLFNDRYAQFHCLSNINTSTQYPSSAQKKHNFTTTFGFIYAILTNNFLLKSITKILKKIVVNSYNKCSLKAPTHSVKITYEQKTLLLIFIQYYLETKENRKLLELFRFEKKIIREFMKRKISVSGSLKRLYQTECMAHTHVRWLVHSNHHLLACSSDDSENNVVLSGGR